MKPRRDFVHENVDVPTNGAGVITDAGMKFWKLLLEMFQERGNVRSVEGELSRATAIAARRCRNKDRDGHSRDDRFHGSAIDAGVEGVVSNEKLGHALGEPLDRLGILLGNVSGFGWIVLQMI